MATAIKGRQTAPALFSDLLCSSSSASWSSRLERSCSRPWTTMPTTSWYFHTSDWGMLFGQALYSRPMSPSWISVNLCNREQLWLFGALTLARTALPIINVISSFPLTGPSVCSRIIPATTPRSHTCLYILSPFPVGKRLSFLGGRFGETVPAGATVR